MIIMMIDDMSYDDADVEDDDDNDYDNDDDNDRCVDQELFTHVLCLCISILV